MKDFTRRNWLSMGAVAGAASLATMLVVNAGPAAAQPEDRTAEEQSVVATCPQPPPVPPTAATADYFLKIDGIPGESASERRRDEIEIQSFSLGVSQASLLTCAPDGTRRTFQPLLISKRIDRSSPKLMEAVAKGTHHQSAVLSVDSRGDDPITYTKITFSDIVISSYSASAGADVLPMDQFSLNYSTVKFEYTRQRPDGSLETTAVCWNVKSNRACTV